MNPARVTPASLAARCVREIPQLARLLEEAYPDPAAFDSAESFARAHHDDIVDMNLEELDRERIRARLRWAFSSRPTEWLHERLVRLDARAEALRQGQPR